MGASRKPDEDDKRRGRELAALRRAAGLTQARLAELLGISTQQLGKYERGENRMPMSRHQLAMKILTGSVVAEPGFADEAAEFRGPAEDKAELRRTLDRIATDLARCRELARLL